MSADGLGDLIGAAVEATLEIAVDPPVRGRARRIFYWSLAALLAGVLVWAYLALS